MPLILAGLALASMNLAAAPAVTAGNPLAPADAGFVQCYGPDATTHVCKSMVAYRRNHDGTWTETMTILPDPGQPLTMELQTPAALRDGQVCITVNRDQVMGSTLHFVGHLVPGDHALPLLAQIADSLAGTLDREVCTTYTPATGGVIARVRIAVEGVTLPDQPVIWVKPDSGYRVMPQAAARSGG